MFSLRNYSLVLKQTILVMFCIIVVVGGTFYLIRKQAVESLTESLQERAMRIGEGTVNRIDQTFFESMRVAELLAARLSERAFEPDELSSILKETLSTAHDARCEILALAVAYKPGAFGRESELMRLTRISGTDNKSLESIEGGQYTGKSWYLETEKYLKGIWCEPFIGDFVKEPIAIYSLPFYEKTPDGGRKFAGVVCVDLSVAFLKAVTAELKIPEEGYAFIISKNGRIIAHPVCDWVFRETIFSLAEKRSDANLAQIAKNMQKHGRGFQKYQGMDSKTSWICYMPLESNSWSLGIVFPEASIFTLVNELELTFWKVSIFGFVILLTVLALISIRVSRRLKGLSLVASEIGRGNFAVDIPLIAGHDELSAFANAFRNMRESLVTHIQTLKDVTAAKEKIESELKVAQEIQKGILPEILPPFPKCEYFEIDAFLHPAREVGGDLYDFFILSDTKICMAIGDVSGKGVPASLFMAVTQTLHRGMARNGELTPGTLVTAMNQALCHNNGAMMFVTYIFAILDLQTGVMTYCNAGHNPFYVLRSNGTVENNVKKHGIPLGIKSDRIYTESTITLSPGDTIFFYTDGIPEAKNSSGEFFGNARLREFLSAENARMSTPKTLTADISQMMNAFSADTEQADDITVLTLRLTDLAKEKDGINIL